MEEWKEKTRSKFPSKGYELILFKRLRLLVPKNALLFYQDPPKQYKDYYSCNLKVMEY